MKQILKKSGLKNHNFFRKLNFSVLINLIIIVIFISAVCLPVEADFAKIPSRMTETGKATATKIVTKVKNKVELPSTETNFNKLNQQAVKQPLKTAFAGLNLFFILVAVFVAIILTILFVSIVKNIRAKGLATAKHDTNQNKAANDISFAVSSFVKHRIRK